MKTTLISTAVGMSAVLFSLTALADPPDPHHGEPKSATGVGAETDRVRSKTQLSRADQAFVFKAATGSLAEVEMGKLAQANGVSLGLMDFGARLVADHQKANHELEQVVRPFGMMLPTQIDKEHAQHCETLKAQTGRDFDTAFTRQMIEGHEKMIRMFQKAAKSADAAPLREFAARTLPTLQEHLRIAQGLSRAQTSSL